MGKLIFRYGCMGSSKTAQALITQFNYEERGMRCLLLKPKMENRDGADILGSRIGLARKCSSVEAVIKDPRDIESLDEMKDVHAIVIDEVQFLEPIYIEALARVADYYDIPIICYGLKTDFRGTLFDASRALVEYADDIEEIPCVCWCGRKAKYNARIMDGQVVREGAQIALGGNDSYTALCRKHFISGDLGPAQS